MEKKGQVGFLELSTHENFLLDMVRIADHAGYDVTIFTTEQVSERVKSRLSGGQFDWTVRDDEPLQDYLKRVQQISSGYDLLYSFPLSGTVLDFYRYYRHPIACPSILSVYNANTWLRQSIRPTWKFYNYLRAPLRERIIDQYDAISVEYAPIRDYFSKQTNRPVYTMSPVIFEGTGQPSGEKCKVTVPGLLESSRRDYDILFEMLDGLPTRLQDRVEVTLLGRPVGHDGHEITAQADTLVDEGWTIKWYTEWIPMSEFNSVIRESDVILSPLKQKKMHGISVESYGRTKASGVLGDAIRFGTPLVLPSFYEIPTSIEPFTQTFESHEELTRIFEGLCGNGDQLRPLQKRAREASRTYSIEHQASRFTSIVQAVNGAET